ncbi:hypothetical protein IGI04_003045 [Brassica rapa subsp. trilocularis]|uniref:NYN domain-containing protein n=1 Tax=Brassica rapa subsp. trilocularis TaxID=1813537 RepID=A0ABQ7NX97_BRACM|nr:hypothetical protein IGI04_003045 [Brassica rapa subsp. trilocularis]
METANTGIFWYLDDCPIPEGLSALKVSQNMRLALSKLNYSGKVFIHAYGDSQKILEDLNHPSGDQTLDFGKASISATKPALVVKDTPGNFDYLGTASIYSPDDESTPLLMLHHSSANTNTGIFWYVDDCPIPEGLSVLKVSQNMKLALSKLNYSGKHPSVLLSQHWLSKIHPVILITMVPHPFILQMMNQHLYLCSITHQEIKMGCLGGF